jgi:hypothetical protein
MNRNRGSVLLLAALTFLLCGAWLYLTSSAPDGLESVAAKLGFAGRATTAGAGPLAGYRFPLAGSRLAQSIAAALLGAAVCFLAAWVVGKFSARRPPRGPQPTEGRGSPLAPGSPRPLD